VRQRCEQTWEVIIVDNGSAPETALIAATFAEPLRLRVIVAREKPNASYARNVGVAAAAGEIICFADADDELDPGYLAAMARALESYDFVTSRVDSVTLNPDWVLQAHGPPWQESEVTVSFDFLPSTGINIAIRRSLFESLGGFREDYSGSQDIEFSWRFQLNTGGSIHFVSEAVYRYRHRDSLRALLRQTCNWGASNVLLYLQFRKLGMGRQGFKAVVLEWLAVAAQLLRVRNKSDLAAFTVRFGYCIGRVRGSIHYRAIYL
jgi:glycosyltransferase involved in cell wall biosynthesis